MTGTFSRGVLFVHSAPRALCPHVEWIVSDILGSKVSMDWTPQPAQEGTYRTEFSWVGKAGTGVQLASALRGWEHLRYEVTEDASATTDGGRWSHTPSLGIFHAQTDVAGNVGVPENRIRAAIEQSQGDPALLRQQLSIALGEAWDEELEPFRYAGSGAPVRWLHQVG
ncbi:hypothetical protein HMPREF2835_09180 [Actinomyces sp. HMSC072A03]|nr:hypothetical protein HMPREF2835_09180 [Actinomyces sp. HMSC072A03]